ncbi:MAG: DNA gyrase subunit A [Kiritimatiellae bacterium]|nr:DNA gyrase subunit A [Kiritimatiellia bacterium]
MSEEENNGDGLETAAGAAIAGTLEDVSIEEELSRDYIDYSMSVIVGRALPDVRDGLKPVHRRCLYGMYRLNLGPGVKHKKSANVVGEVMGKFHPHGDSSIYDTIVRMAQPFSMRLPMVDGHGNFGSIDGDSPAAMRYTEVRMHKAAEEMQEDIEKDTVDMVPNYDETQLEPSVLPAKLPNLLLNGSSGIAVGMATNIPPHNLGELCDGLDYYVQHRDGCTVEDLMKFVKGPDFPTGAQICGYNGIAAMYKLGRGQLTVRGKAEIERLSNGRERIIITEIPYAVNKREMLIHMSDLVKDKVIQGVSDIRDESKADIRIIVEVKRDAMAEIVLNNLYKHTQLQTTFGAIMLAIDGGRPKILNLHDFFRAYTDHRFDVLTRRTRFELKKAQARKHILDGLLVAIDNLDEVVSMIRSSRNRDEAKARLVERFGFTEPQVNAILEMRLYQLTGLERDKLTDELAKLLATIAELEAILADPEKVYALIRQDLADIKARYCSKAEAKRRTEIVPDENEVSVKDLIPDEPCVITLSNRGYIKRVPLTEYREQRRGGAGVRGAQVKEEDFIRLVFVAQTHDSMLFFTNTGRLFRKEAYQIPEGAKTSFGKPLINLLDLQEGEQILELLPIREVTDEMDVFFATRNGTVKKTSLLELERVNKNGKRALNIDEGDELVDVRVVSGDEDVIMFTRNGRAMRFASADVRRMGRSATGVRGIRLREGDAVVSLDAVDDSKTLFIATENGYGKRCEFKEFARHGRGGQGMIAIKVEEKNGAVVAAHAVSDDEHVISITSDQQMVRSPVSQFNVYGRYSRGVKLVRLSEGATLVSVSVSPGDDDDEKPAANAPETPPESPEATE